MRGRPWILPPDALVIQSGSPREASAGHGLERRQGPRKRYGAGSEVRTAAGCRLRLSAAATTQAPKRPRSPEAIRSHSSDRNEYFISMQIYAQTGILTHNFLDLAGEHCSDRKSDRFGRGCHHAFRAAGRAHRVGFCGVPVMPAGWLAEYGRLPAAGGSARAVEDWRGRRGQLRRLRRRAGSGVRGLDDVRRIWPRWPGA